MSSGVDWRSGGRGSPHRTTGDQSTEPAVPLLSGREITKWYGSRKALDGVDLDVFAGEVHAIVGVNGSGKSTLVKVLSGVLRPERGALAATGATSGSDPSGTSAPVVSIHQELGLFEEGTAAENIVGVGTCRMIISARHEQRIAAALLESVGAPPDLSKLRVKVLSAEQRALVAFARALRNLGDQRRAVMIVDEITSILRGERRDVVLSAMARLRTRGIGILFISHDIDEVLAVADRITVMRDGSVQAAVRAAETTSQELLQLMTVGAMPAHARSRQGDRANQSSRSGFVGDGGTHAALRAEDLAGGTVQRFSISVAPGEVVGVAGSAGSGCDEIPYLLTGFAARSGGVVRVRDRIVKNPAQFYRAGGRVVPAQRHELGLALRGSVYENALLGKRGGAARCGVSRTSLDAKWVAQIIDKYGVKCVSMRTPIGALSGGNQQKVIVGRCIESRPSALVLHEATQGVDVVARREIISILREAAVHDQLGMIYVSSELDELTELCDRIVIMRDGEVVDSISDAHDANSIEALLY